MKKAVPVRLEALGTVTPIASVAIKARLETVITRGAFRGRRPGQGRAICCSRSTAARSKPRSSAWRPSSPARQAQLEQAERDVQRYTELVAKNATTVVTLNNAQTQVNISRATAEFEQGDARKSQGSARLHQDPRADLRPHQRRQCQGRQFRAAGRHRAARHHHPDRAGLRDVHGAATHAARCAPGAGRRERDRSRRSFPASSGAPAARSR